MFGDTGASLREERFRLDVDKGTFVSERSARNTGWGAANFFDHFEEGRYDHYSLFQTYAEEYRRTLTAINPNAFPADQWEGW